MAVSTVGPWAREKLERLRKYLEAYTTILSTKSFEGFYYIDAFAGPGSHEIKRPKQDDDINQMLLDISRFGSDQKEQKAFLAGSPRVALEIPSPFKAYFFVEKSAERISELQKLKAEYGGRRQIQIRPVECNQYLFSQVARNAKIDWKRNRAVVFLDPFGMQVQWKTIEALAETKAVEIFLNFPVGMAIQRLLLRAGEFTAKQRLTLDNYFGASTWFDALYKKEKTLFADEQVTKLERSGERLVNWYRDHLKTKFAFVSKAALIQNTRRGHLYYLLLATHNRTGYKIANDIFVSAGEAV